MTHLALLGDSILDNGAYAARGGDVLTKLTERLPSGARATLLAVDGAVIAGVRQQLRRLPADATHLVISAGGNDALGEAAVLREPARSVAEAVGRIAAVRDRFATSYRGLLADAAATGLPVAICTIYDALLPDPTERRLAATALTALNDVITREAAARRLPVIDLRVLFDREADYANAIEPSARGAEKIAAALVRLLGGHDWAGPSAIYAAAA